MSGIVLVRLKWRVFCWSMQQCWSDVCVRYRIGPFEVESVLLEHAAVLESAVVSSPDTIRGEVSYCTVLQH